MEHAVNEVDEAEDEAALEPEPKPKWRGRKRSLRESLTRGRESIMFNLMKRPRNLAD